MNRATESLNFYIKQHYRNLIEIDTTLKSIEDIDKYITDIVLMEVKKREKSLCCRQGGCSQR